MIDVLASIASPATRLAWHLLRIAATLLVIVINVLAGAVRVLVRSMIGLDKHVIYRNGRQRPARRRCAD